MVTCIFISILAVYCNVRPEESWEWTALHPNSETEFHLRWANSGTKTGKCCRNRHNLLVLPQLMAAPHAQVCLQIDGWRGGRGGGGSRVHAFRRSNLYCIARVEKNMEFWFNLFYDFRLYLRKMHTHSLAWVQMHRCIHACTHWHKHATTCRHTCTCTNVHPITHKHTQTQTKAHTHTHTHTQTSTHTCMHIHTRKGTHIQAFRHRQQTQAQTQTQTQTDTDIYRDADTDSHIDRHTYTHIHTHTHTHTWNPTCYTHVRTHAHTHTNPNEHTTHTHTHT